MNYSTLILTFLTTSCAFLDANAQFLPAPLTLAPVSLPPVTAPPISLAPVTLPPASLAPVTLPPASLAPVTIPPVSLAPVTIPPVSLTPVTIPPVSLAPVTVPPVSLAPVTIPPVSLTPVTIPPVSLAPVTVPPVSLAPVTIPPVSLTPVSLPPVTIPPVSLQPVSSRGLDSTLTIAVADNSTGLIGALGTSCTIGLFDLVYHYVAGYGLCLTQGLIPEVSSVIYANINLMLASGASPQEIISYVTTATVDVSFELRQYGCVNFELQAAGYTGLSIEDYYLGLGLVLTDPLYLSYPQIFEDIQGVIGSSLVYSAQGSIYGDVTVDLLSNFFASASSSCDLAERMYLSLSFIYETSGAGGTCSALSLGTSIFLHIDDLAGNTVVHIESNVLLGALDGLGLTADAWLSFKAEYDAWRLLNPCPGAPTVSSSPSQALTLQPISIPPVTIPPVSFQPASVPLEGTLQPATFQPQTFQPQTFQPATFQPATFQPATFQPVIPLLSTQTPSLRPVTARLNDAPIIAPSSNCYESWSPKYYHAGEIITGQDDRNYACDTNYFLYCSWAEFEPGTGGYPDYSSLAWNLLSTVCTVPLATTPPPALIATSPPTSPSVPTVTPPTGPLPSPTVPTVTPPSSTGCPAPFDDSKVYIAGNFVSYASVIYQCITSNGRCYQAGYEPWSPLVGEAWLVIGTCTGTVAAPAITCPPFFDKFLRVYTAGDLASYGNVIYECITSSGRCVQDGYEPWSTLGGEAWKVVGTCNATRNLRQRKV